MSITDELLEAEGSVLQDKWDAYLVESWRLRKPPLMSTQCVRFMKMYEVSQQQFSALKRTPRAPWQADHTGVQRFCAAYLPRISNYLFDHMAELSDPEKLAEVVHLISASGIDTRFTESDRKKAAAERAERRAATKENQVGQIKQGIASANRDRFRRSAWSVCK